MALHQACSHLCKCCPTWPGRLQQSTTLCCRLHPCSLLLRSFRERWRRRTLTTVHPSTWDWCRRSLHLGKQGPNELFKVWILCRCHRPLSIRSDLLLWPVAWANISNNEQTDNRKHHKDFGGLKELTMNQAGFPIKKQVQKPEQKPVT